MSESSRMAALAVVIVITTLVATTAALARQSPAADASVALSRAASESPHPIPDVIPLPSGAEVVTLARPAAPGGGAILYVHGGGWSGGEAAEVLPGLDLASHARDGWAILSLEYRLASLEAGVDADDQVDDVDEALAWLDDSGPAHGVPGPVIAVGHSAGAHLAAVSAARPGPAPDAVVGVAGVYDTATDVRSNPMLAGVLADAIGCADCNEGLPAPGTWATDDDPPVHLVHGAGDPIAPVASAERYMSSLHAAGVVATVNIIAGSGHGDDGVGRVTRAIIEQLLSASR